MHISVVDTLLLTRLLKLHVSYSRIISFTTFNGIKYQKERESRLMPYGYFNKEEKNKKTFLEAINKYREREKRLRGHIDFIYSALNYMEEFGVHKELQVYKELLNLMPKDKMIPRNVFQAEFHHYPKHQDCAINVLEKMNYHDVMPDSEVEAILTNTFGRWGGPTRKYMRMMYWMPKFKHISPWPLPVVLPDDALELAKLAIAQITSVDPAGKVEVLQTRDLEDAVDKTWIVSAMSPTQKELIGQIPEGSSLKVEGPFGVYLRDVKVGYFVLRADPLPSSAMLREDVDDVRNICISVLRAESKDVELYKPKSVHEQDDGIIITVCATGTSSRDSLLSWIRLLERSVPSLKDRPILFTQSSPIGEIMVVDVPKADSP